MYCAVLWDVVELPEFRETTVPVGDCWLLSYIHNLPPAQWLRCCATNRKVAGSIPAGVIGILH